MENDVTGFENTAAGYNTRRIGISNTYIVYLIIYACTTYICILVSLENCNCF